MKKIKFPLEMADGRQVRELEEFRRYFDLERALEYFTNGKLQKWLRNLYCEDILEELEGLTGKEEDFIPRFTEALGVEYHGDGKDVRTLFRRGRLKELLKQFFPEPELEEYLEDSADDQETLELCIEEGRQTIYLVSGEFQIPKTAKQIKFIGIGQTRVSFEETDKNCFLEQELFFQGVSPMDERSGELLDMDQTLKLKLALLDVLEGWLQMGSGHQR